MWGCINAIRHVVCGILVRGMGLEARDSSAIGRGFGQAPIEAGDDVGDGVG